MTQITNHTNVEEILERVRREFGFEEGIYIDDVREWVWDSIGIIGSKNLLIEKQTDLKVSNHRAKLPIDVFDLTNHRVRDKNSKRVLKKTNNLFFKDDKKRRQSPIVSTEAAVEYDGVDFSDGTEYKSIIYPEYEAEGYYYMIKGDTLYTALEECEVELLYTAFPIDERNFPMIPNDPHVIKVIVWYIGERLAYKYMIQDKLSERKYHIIAQDYAFAAASARSKVDMLDIPDMHNFKHRVLQMNKQTDAFLKGFE